MKLVSKVKDIVPARWRRKGRELALPLRVKHVFGAKRIHLAPNEAAVACLLKNGEFYLESFIQHYSALGFRHIFLLDNGSSDRTIEIAGSFPNVTLYQCGLPVETYQGSLKKYLAENTIFGGWCLDVDIDEFFEHPSSHTLSLLQFLEYLNRRQYTCVITQMLDMFSDRPLSYLSQKKTENLKEVYRYYDISQVRKEVYENSGLGALHGGENVRSHKDTVLCFGGIRKTLYGIDPLLTKHSLFRTGQGLDLFPHVHFVNKARLADLSCLLLHYKLTSNVEETCRQNQTAFSGIGKGYRDLRALVATQPDYQIRQSTAVEFNGIEDLVRSAFLFVSDDFRAWARSAANLKP